MDSVIFNTHDVVLLMTAYQCILYSILLLAVSRGHMPKNLFLALFLFSHAAIPLDILINFGEEFRYVAMDISPNLFYVFGFAYWLEGPLLLWYTRSVLYKNYLPKKHEWVYLIPFAAYLIYEIAFYYSLSNDAKLSLQQGYDLALAPKYMNYVTLLRELIRLGFGIACVVEIRRYRARIRDNFSDIQSIDFKWLNLLVDGFLVLRVIAVLVALMILASIHSGFNLDFSSAGLAANYLAFLLVSVLIFFSLRHSSIIASVEESLVKPEANERAPYEKGDIDRLMQFIEKDKPYLQHSLTVDDLATAIGLSQKTLSAMINRHFGKNFYEFINGYRIDEARHILSRPDSERTSILDVLYAAGFNSKATFNTLFKKHTGMTPSEYRKRHAGVCSSQNIP
ncbi:helix-turn-helix domain-containing protein [Gilvimarinus algae]|uniref:AraC family transcriptional regulator n=1 Tax=Gilvimarinus algae TaxID=3058037 RepID=A0ABT8TIC2_9GAMM|nr:AraC family transcriptional regulator [Gilvimarinus sp. SDUM040014]MDO3383335.1 AraC family transcriptional regulator [Gilvimarinus sp. SDUM040014]